MAKITWKQIADEEFYDMNKEYQEDWRELRDRVS